MSPDWALLICLGLYDDVVVALRRETVAEQSIRCSVVVCSGSGIVSSVLLVIY